MVVCFKFKRIKDKIDENNDEISNIERFNFKFKSRRNLKVDEISNEYQTI